MCVHALRRRETPQTRVERAQAHTVWRAREAEARADESETSREREIGDRSFGSLALVCDDTGKIG